MTEDLPEFTRLSERQIREYFPLWLKHRATGQRHLLSELMNEPEEPYFAIFEIESAYQLILKLRREEHQNG